VARTTFRLAYRAVRVADGVTVALAETGMAGYDYARSHPAPLPEPVAAPLRKDAP
jgi:acyl-CoA thioesterase FadM